MKHPKFGTMLYVASDMQIRHLMLVGVSTIETKEGVETFYHLASPLYIKQYNNELKRWKRNKTIGKKPSILDYSFRMAPQVCFLTIGEAALYISKEAIRAMGKKKR